MLKKIKLTLLFFITSISIVNAQFPLAEIEGNTFINGKLGIGTDSAFRELTTIGWIRSSSDASQTNNIELFHGGSHGFINVTGAGNLDFRKNGLTQMSMTGTGNFGIGETSPSEKLEVAGGIRLENASSDTPDAGTIRWNEVAQDFEGYDGSNWTSLTSGCSTTGSMHTGPPVPPMCCEESFTGSDGNLGDQFGSSVAIDGNYAVVGARGTSKVYIFKYFEGIWSEDTILSVDNGLPSWFGGSVSISSDYIVVGSELYDTLGNINQGAAFIYQKLGSEWHEQARIIAVDGAPDDRFGASVSISGDFVVVGTPQQEINGQLDQGSAYIFERSGIEWEEKAKLVAFDGLSSDKFGTSVSISGDNVIVGAPDHDIDGNTDQGAAYIFHRQGNVWEELPKIFQSSAFHTKFGMSVSINGDYIAIGAPSPAEFTTGDVEVFKNVNNTWVSQESLHPSEGTLGMEFGYSVSIKGDYIIASAPNNVPGGNLGYIYHFNGMNWIEIESLKDPFGGGLDQYGYSVCTDGANRLVGVPFADVNGDTDRGKVVFGPVD